MVSIRHGARQGACVLCFHRVVDERRRDHDVEWRSFCTLLDALAQRNRTFDTELRRPIAAGVVLTFDDGTADHVRVARELARRAIRAVFFVTPDRLGRAGFLNAADLRQLRTHGHVVASHGLHHSPLGDLRAADVSREVGESKGALERVLGAPVRYFAPPGGSDHPHLRAALEATGYEACRSLRWGLYRSSAERWAIPALPVTEYTIRHGWVEQAAATLSLPLALRCASLARSAAPAPLRRTLRTRLHARLDKAGAR